MAEQINTADEVIDRLGGNSKVAALVGLKPNAVGMWRERGLPRWTFLLLSKALNERDLYASPDLWRIRAVEAGAEAESSA